MQSCDSWWGKDAQGGKLLLLSSVQFHYWRPQSSRQLPLSTYSLSSHKHARIRFYSIFFITLIPKCQLLSSLVEKGQCLKGQVHFSFSSTFHEAPSQGYCKKYLLWSYLLSHLFNLSNTNLSRIWYCPFKLFFTEQWKEKAEHSRLRKREWRIQLPSPTSHAIRTHTHYYFFLHWSPDICFLPSFLGSLVPGSQWHLLLLPLSQSPGSQKLSELRELYRLELGIWVRWRGGRERRMNKLPCDVFIIC